MTAAEESQHPTEALHSAMVYSADHAWDWLLHTTTRQCAASGQARTFAEALRQLARAAEKAEAGVMPEKIPVPFMSWGQCQCLRCGGTWSARKKNWHTPPKRCAKCRSPYWNKQRQRAGANEKERELLLLIRAGKAGRRSASGDREETGP
jgi:hypothetical protein